MEGTGGDAFDLPGVLRRIRRLSDVSQRELAERLEVSKSAIAAAEGGRAGLDARVLARAALLARLRIAMLDANGNEVAGMAVDAVRDLAGRRFPAHLDTRHGDDRWWYDREPRYGRERPWYTFDRSREARDSFRRLQGTAEDHQLPPNGDSPEERTAARRREQLRREHERRERAFRSGERSTPVEFECSCPPSCEELDDHSGRPVHADDCSCLCDVG